MPWATVAPGEHQPLGNYMSRTPRTPFKGRLPDSPYKQQALHTVPSTASPSGKPPCEIPGGAGLPWEGRLEAQMTHDEPLRHPHLSPGSVAMYSPDADGQVAIPGGEEAKHLACPPRSISNPNPDPDWRQNTWPTRRCG